MSSTQNVQALLEQSGWIHALARRLVADPHAAADLAQDTLVDALEHRPRGALRAWLGTVLRNNARKLRRGEAHRGVREQARPAPLGPPSPPDVVARAATHRDLVLAVMALEEPYRSTILLRFFEQLSYEEIAARSGTTRAGVNSRITRGLERLRLRLAAEHGDDPRALYLALAPLAKLPTGVATTFLGLNLMHATIGITTAALLTLTLTVGLQQRGSGETMAATGSGELAAPRSRAELRAPFVPPERLPAPAAAAPLQREQAQQKDKDKDGDKANRWKTELFQAETLEATIESLAVSTSAGDVQVVPSPSGKLEISAKITADTTRVAAEKLTQVFADHVKVERKDKRLLIANRRENERGWSVSFVVGVPRALPLDANSGSGSVIVKYAAGAVRANSGSGNVRVELPDQAVRKLNANSGSGNVFVDALSIEDLLEVNSGSGDLLVAIRTAHSAGKAVLNTGSGDVTLMVAASVVGSFELETAAGEIEVPPNLGILVEKAQDGSMRASGKLGNGGAYRLRSGSGDLTIELQ